MLTPSIAAALLLPPYRSAQHAAEQCGLPHAAVRSSHAADAAGTPGKEIDHG